MQKLTRNHYIRKIYALMSRSVYFPPLVVLMAILVITIWPWHNARQTKKANFEQSVNEKVDMTQANLTERFGVYHTSLQSGAGLFQSDANTTKNQWNTFFAYKQRTTNRSGVQGTGFSKFFSAAEYPAVRAAMQNQGVPDFEIKPTALDANFNSAVLYLYSVGNNTTSAIGYNMLSEPTRKEAILRAINTGAAALTHKVTLVQDVKTTDSQGFLLYVPVYKNGSDISTPEARQANIDGIVYGGFRAGILFDQMLEGVSKSQHFSVSVYDGENKSENLLYQTSNTKQLADSGHAYRVVREVQMYGVVWRFEYVFDGSRVLSRSENNAPAYIVTVGIITALLVFLALLLIFKSSARELQQQKDKEVDLAKDELLSLASHQMRTPATGVKQYLGMVLQGFAGKLTESQTALLDKAYTSNERQLHVINQILHLAKLEAGRIVLAKHKTNLNDLMNDIVDEHRDEIAAHGHQLKVKLPKDEVVISIDAHMIRMVIENILSNAIKYTVDPGKITLQLSQTKAFVKISIQDTGVGINQKEYGTIFKQFTRLYDEQTEQVSGTGIGLYLADQLVKLHKGTLQVNSMPGEGSEFIIVLPQTKRKN